MKLKVLLVDDEKLERILIRKGFPWEENGFEIIGEAESGRDALEFIRTRRPDLVLTDISMANMDGLEFTERLMEKFPGIHVVMITGYREFDYARQAVKLGVDDFLLKPINVTEVGKVVEKIKAEIFQKREVLKEKEEWEKRKNEGEDILRESFLQRLIENRIPEKEVLKKLSVYGCSALEENSCCMLLGVKEEEKKSRKNRDKLMEILKEKEFSDCICFLHYMGSIVLLFMKGEETYARECAEEILRIAREEKLEVTIGISRNKQGIPGISRSFEEAGNVHSASVILGQNRILTYQDYEPVMEQGQAFLDFPWEDFTFSLKNGMEEKVCDMVDSYVEMMRNSKKMDVDFLKLMVMNMISKESSTMNKYGTNLFQTVGEDGLVQEILSLRTIDDCRRLLQKSAEWVLKFHEQKSRAVRQENRVVAQAVKYIEENFSDPDMSLKQAADAVFSNASYLSRMLKKETGENLTDYVTKKRIEKSIELLNTTDMRVYEIAEKVGFRDPHYFSISFRKQMGVTIKEFRSRNQEK